MNNCPSCRSLNNKTVIKLNKENQDKFKSLSQLKFGGYLEEITPDTSKVKISKCFNCGHHWYTWRPTDDQLIEMYDKHAILKKEKIKSKAIKNEKYIMEELIDIKNYSKKKKPILLDYGAGFGNWNRIAKGLNYNAYGYEPSSKRRGGDEDKNNGVQLIYNLNEIKSFKPDLINLEQVLEHIPQPVSILKTIYQICNTSTLVRVRVPNISRAKEGKDLYSLWPYSGTTTHTLTPYEHLHGFTQKSLLLACQRAGFKIAYRFMLSFRPTILIRQTIGRSFLPISTTTIYLSK